MKLLLALTALLLSHPALASWHYNEDGGFGIYQPEGWRVEHEGRSSRLTGPENDVAQSEIFLGSDWQTPVTSLEKLRAYVSAETGEAPEATTVSGLEGFRAGTPLRGSVYLLRAPENVIVVRYELRGSSDQVEEGRTMLSSIEIRTRGIENARGTAGF
jgi:hypothetical protein